MKAMSVKASLLASSVATLGLSILFLPACNGPMGSLSSIPASTGAAPEVRSTAVPFVFQTVNNNNSNTNEVTGINQRNKIVGTFGAGVGSQMPQSYTGEPPYGKFRGINYPGSQGTEATSLTTTRIVGGYVINPNELGGIWGFIRANGVWALLKHPKEGSDSNAVTKILGLNDSKFAVGYYVNNAGVEVPFELNINKEDFTNLHPLYATSAEATGVNNKGYICGFERLSDGSHAGYYLQEGTYYELRYPNALNTWALGINILNQIVGQYEDQNHALHGFMLTYPRAGSGQRVWQSIDISGAVSTKVTSINNHDFIAGSYYTSDGHENGFIGTPKK